MNSPAHRQRRRLPPIVVTGLITTILMMIAPAAANAATYTSTALNATVSGSTVTATTTIKASSNTAAALAGICARSSSGAHYDFPLSAATLTTAGTSFTKSRTLPNGTYSYWSCAKVGGVWTSIGTSKSFTVGSSGVSAPTDGSNPSGQAMPQGDLPGWKQVFKDDFTTTVSPGSFPGAYSSKWTGYDGFNDTDNIGRYDLDNISVSGGAMDIHLRTTNGQVQTAAPAPIVTTAWKGQTYGRYTIRFKADSVANFKTAWLLWPDSNNWNQGEINFPEGELNSKMMGYNHCINNPTSNCYWFDSAIQYSAGWHTATIEWIPGKITFSVDGKSGSTTSSVPSVPLHWVLQTETSGRPSSSASGHILIDWVSVYTYTG